MTDAEKLEYAMDALEMIAAEAYVSLDDLPHHDQPNGWRKVAVDRIDIARMALAHLNAEALK